MDYPCANPVLLFCCVMYDTIELQIGYYYRQLMDFIANHTTAPVHMDRHRSGHCGKCPSMFLYPLITIKQSDADIYTYHIAFQFPNHSVLR